MTRSDSPFARVLRRALLANAVFSAVSALVFLAMADKIATLVGSTPAEITQTGAALVIFAGLIAVVATRPNLYLKWVLATATLIAGMDVLWVATTPFKIIEYTASGKLIFGLITLVVLGFALVQIYALAGLFRTRRTVST